MQNSHPGKEWAAKGKQIIGAAGRLAICTHIYCLGLQFPPQPTRTGPHGVRQNRLGKTSMDHPSGDDNAELQLVEMDWLVRIAGMFKGERHVQQFAGLFVFNVCSLGCIYLVNFVFVYVEPGISPGSMFFRQFCSSLLKKENAAKVDCVFVFHMN